MSSVDGVVGIYVFADPHGDVFFVDGATGNRVRANPPLTPRPKPPLDVRVSRDLAGNETCIIVDAAGNCWRGHPRPNAMPFTLIS